MNKDFVIKNTRNYDEWLIEQLKNPEEALAYLEAALEEYIADNDVNALGCAILNFFHAQYLTLQLMSLTGIYINNFERYQNFTTDTKSVDFLRNLSVVDFATNGWGLSKKGKPVVQHVDHIHSGGLVDIGVTYG